MVKLTATNASMNTILVSIICVPSDQNVGTGSVTGYILLNSSTRKTSATPADVDACKVSTSRLRHHETMSHSRAAAIGMTKDNMLMLIRRTIMIDTLKGER